MTGYCLALSLPDRCLFSSSTPSRYQLSAIFKKCKPQSELGGRGGGPARVPAAPAAPGPAPSPAPVPPCPAPYPRRPPRHPRDPGPRAANPEARREGQGGHSRRSRSRTAGVWSKPWSAASRPVTWGHPWVAKAPGGNPLPESLRPCSSQESVLLPVTYRALSLPEAQFIPNKQLQPKESQIYIKQSNAQCRL